MANTNIETQAEMPYIVGSKYLSDLNVRFIRDSSALLRNLGKLYYSIEPYVNDRRKFTRVSKELRLIEYIKNLIQSGNWTNLMSFLNETYVIEFIKKYNPELATKIVNFRDEGDLSQRVLNGIRSFATNIEKLLANLDIILGYAPKIQEGSIKSKVITTLSRIQNIDNERSALIRITSDLAYWERHVHDDISFYTQTVNEYFQGTSDPNNTRQFISLQSYKDKKLDNFRQSKEVRTLSFIAQYTYGVDNQLEFISKLIRLLQTDIKQNVWVNNVGTKEFYSKIEDYAEIFRSQYKNSAFADSLLSMKKKLGEQPFAWIEILQKMERTLGRFMTMKDNAIFEAQKSLSQNFGSRIQELTQEIDSLTNFLIKLTQSGSLQKSFLHQLRKGLRSIESKLVRNFRRILVKNRKYKLKIQNLSLRVLPEMDRALNEISLKQESIRVRQKLISKIRYESPKKKLLEIIGRHGGDNPGLIPHFSQLAFIFARMQENEKEIERAVQKAEEKEANLKNLNLDLLRSNVDKLINLFEEYIRWISSLQLSLDPNLIQVSQAINGINKFRGVVYG